MKKLQDLLLTSSLVALTACAGQTYRADVGAMFPIVSGDIALQASSPAALLPQLGQRQNDFDSEFGVGDTEVSPYLRLQMDDDKHRVRVHGFGVDAEGSGTLLRPYGNILAGSQVQTSLEFFNITAAYGYEIVSKKHYRVAVGGELGFYTLDVAAASGAGRETVETQAFVPMPYLEVEGLFDQLTVGANAGWISADLGDANGIYWDLEAYVRWQATDKFDALVGYRNLRIDSYGRASTRNFDADVDVQGFFIGGGIRF